MRAEYVLVDQSRVDERSPVIGKVGSVDASNDLLEPNIILLEVWTSLSNTIQTYPSVSVIVSVLR